MKLTQGNTDQNCVVSSNTDSNTITSSYIGWVNRFPQDHFNPQWNHFLMGSWFEQQLDRSPKRNRFVQQLII